MRGSAGIDTFVLGDGVVLGLSDGIPDVDPEEYDLLLTATADPPRPWVTGSAEPVEAAIRQAPAAAVALVEVLRVTEAVSVGSGLAVESLAYSMLQHGGAFQRWLGGRSEPPPRNRAEDPVRLERDGNRLEIVLRRPSVHNAMSAAMRDALCEAFDLVDADPMLTDVHLLGEGPSFCSGGDLDEFGLATDAANAHLVRVSHSVGRRVHEHAGNVTAHLHGSCIGAGIEIAAFAGRLVAGSDTTIRLPELAMGLIPGAGGTVSIPRRIGRHRTAYLALTGETIDAATAFRWGLVDELG